MRLVRVTAKAIAALAAVPVLIVACAGPAPSPVTTVDPLDLRYTCGTFDFAPEALTDVAGPDGQSTSPAAVALTRFLTDPIRLNPRLPLNGWRPIGSDEATAEFASIAADQAVWVTVVRKEGGAWVVGSPDVCEPLLVLPAGLARADWTFDPAQGAPTGATQVFDAFVTERGCNSGQPADGRIVGPQVVRTATEVLVIFAVRPRGGGQRCPSNPPVRVRVDLGEALGERRLLDGGHLPYGDPRPRA